MAEIHFGLKAVGIKPCPYNRLSRIPEQCRAAGAVPRRRREAAVSGGVGLPDPVFLVEHFRDQEGQFERLRGVQALSLIHI